jgi:hypothetical protein
MGRIRGWITGCLSAGFIAFAGIAVAESRPVVVELFTSQGCSSCPPADAFLHELSKRDDVIALALHVDYWDYIGWKDVFAQPAFTKRQKAYAKAGGRRSVYTPQLIIGGQDHVVGTHEENASALIQQHAAADHGVVLRAEKDSAGTVTVRAEAQAGVSGPMVVYLVRYMPRKEVEITRGENAGKTIAYTNIVTDWSAIGEWDPATPLMLQSPAQGDTPGVVLLQQKGIGAIMAAAHIR